MTVKELIAKLKPMKGNLLVVLSRDPEGNGYEELRFVQDNSRYDNGEVGVDRLTPALKKQGFGEEDLMPDGQPCIVMYP